MTTPSTKGNGFFSNEPQIVQGAVFWLLAQVGALIVGHTHLLSSGQWSSFATGLVPIITALVIGAIALVWRRYLSPAWKVVQNDINKIPGGQLIEAEVKNQIEAYLASLEGKLPASTPNEADAALSVDPEQVDGEPSVGTPAPGEANGVAQAG